MNTRQIALAAASPIDPPSLLAELISERIVPIVSARDDDPDDAPN